LSGSSVHSQKRSWKEASFDLKGLLELSDSVRASLHKEGDLGPDSDRLSTFLELALSEETHGSTSIDFQTLKLARLDKLVADLTKCSRRVVGLSPRSRRDVATAGKLERMWRNRFKDQYFMMDEIRTADLATRWQLKESSSALSDARPQSSRTGSGSSSVVDPKDDVHFEAGQ
jgi:hypothetical protein